MNFVVKHCTTAVHILTNKCMYKQIGILYYTCCKYTLWCKKNCTLFSAVTVSIFKNSVRFRFFKPKNRRRVRFTRGESEWCISDM